jgi:uncharacterized protein (TIGR02596 family)
MYHPRPAAFTLVELLAVIAIILLLASLSVTAFNKIGDAKSLSSAANTLSDQLNLARQTALSRNCQAEIRFYELPHGDGSRTWRAVQIFTMIDGTASATGKPVYFPAPICIAGSSVLSSLLDDSRADIMSGTGSEVNFRLPGIGLDYRYRAFRFKPDGTTSLASSVFVTLCLASAKLRDDEPPPHWMTVQVDSVNGRARTFHP